MPDFTTRTYYACKSNRFWVTCVKGSKGKSYNVCWSGNHKTPGVHWSCSCKAYQFRHGYCKHIIELVNYPPLKGMGLRGK